MCHLLFLYIDDDDDDDDDNDDDDDDDDNDNDNDNDDDDDEFFVTDKVSDLVDDDDDHCLKTRRIIPFGWLINLERITLFILFLSGGAKSALLSKGVWLQVLINLPSLLLSLLSSESAQRLLLLLELLSLSILGF